MALNGRPTHGCYEGMSHIFQDSQDDQDLIDFVTLDALGSRGYEYPIDFHLSSPEFQSDVSTAVTNVDLNEFQNLVKPNLDDPWTYGQPRNQQALPSFTITDVSSRANTVAGDPKAEYNFLRRPALQQRLSQDSRVDSAFSEIHSISEGPELSPIYLSEEALGASYVHVPRPTPSVRSAQTAPSGKKRKGTKEIAIPCRRPHCTKVSKNRSDAEKHHKQHLRLFKCEEPGCRRVEGFGTPNDLERHRKSVHRRFPTVGKNTAYICQACPQDDKHSKHWPRLDNFKAHINRKHQGCDVQALIKSSEVPWIGSESGYGGSQDIDAHECDELFSSMPATMSRHSSYAGQNFAQDSSVSLTGIGAGHVSDMNSLVYMGSPAFQRSHSVVDGSPLYQDQSLDPKLALVPYFDPSQACSDMNGMQMQDDSLPADLDLFGMRPLQTTDEKNQKLIYCPAPECGKVKHRLSEFRKHLKRHTRPYGCTFAGCTMRLGSRNDWKRHESSQHVLNDEWLCQKCRVLFHDRKDFTSHLQHLHSVPSNQLTETCQKSHLGRGGHYNFWCGFCNALIPQQHINGAQEGPSMTAWEYRFKHIGDHYDKGNFLIDQWIRIDQPAPQSSSTMTIATRPKQQQLPNYPSTGTNTPNPLPRWLAPPSPLTPHARRTRASTISATSTRTKTPLRMMTMTSPMTTISNSNSNSLEQDVRVFFPQNDDGRFVHQSNAVGSVREFGAFDDLRDAEGEEEDGGF